MIKKRREKLGFSQRQLAYLSGVSNTEIKRIEDGDRKQPSQEILCKLANPLRSTAGKAHPFKGGMKGGLFLALDNSQISIAVVQLNHER
jgi:transcriptional regulator with XRE-family HTH domain